MGKTFIVAEIGVNHNGDIELGKKLIEAAARAGADAIKTQLFVAEKLVSVGARKASYQIRATGGSDSQLEMLKKLELSAKQYKILNDYANSKCGATLFAAPFDLESLNVLEQLTCPIIKIPSGEITNLPLLQAIARIGAPKIFLSTGMSTMDEVLAAIDVFKNSSEGSSGGLSGGSSKGSPKGTSEESSGGSPKVKSKGTSGGSSESSLKSSSESSPKGSSSELTLLHCHTQYPTNFSDVNLLAMTTMREMTGLNIGFSDHTPGIEAAIAAVALGATVVEKHFTLDRTLPGPDHRASLEPEEFDKMVRAIRNIEDALGDGIKMPSQSEAENIDVARKSIVATRPIRWGEVISEDMIAAKRPGSGMSPMYWYNVIGKPAPRDFAADEQIKF